MTATATQTPPQPPQQKTAPSWLEQRDDTAPHRTLMALLAVGLGITPLKALLSDSMWLIEAWLTMVVVIAPAAVLRLRRPPSALDVWPGIVLLVPWLTRLFVPQHAIAALIPTPDTFTDISHLMQSLHRTTQDEVAPIHSTTAVRLVICALVGLLAALVDLIAVVGRRGALAGVPLLVVYTVSGAVPRSPVAWGWFAVAAIGFLVLLGLDANDEIRGWGRRISRHGSGSGRPGMAFSAPRIGVLAVIAAVILPALLPSDSKNLLTEFFRSSGGSGLGGFGAGSGSDGTGSISPFVALKGQLDRSKPVPLLTVHVDGGAVPPQYMRTNILDKYTDDVGWSVSNHGSTESLTDTGYSTDWPNDAPPTTHFHVTVTVDKLTGNAPIFSMPEGITGLPEKSKWSSRDEIVTDDSVRKSLKYDEDVAQPEPTIQDLEAAPPVDARQMARWLQLPKLPSYVTQLVAQLVKGADSPYARARAISDYFADPNNQFVYSLKTKEGDSGSALVDFLRNGTGYCQQYAAAMAVMLRQAHVPSRVVLGYMHAPPDRNGNFTITTSDAHAWVEAYFPGIGWIPFDPTPPAGLSGNQKSDLSWAPHVYPSTTAPAPTSARSSSALNPRKPDGGSSSATAAVAVGHHGGSPGGLIWVPVSVAVLMLVGLIPAGTRAARRRRRYAAARHGDPDPLWAELSDTATDLGYVWSPARSPRQVSAWLARDAGDSAPQLHALAEAVEQRRYAPESSGRDAAGLARGLRAVEQRLRAQRGRGLTWRARLWPASLGWHRGLGSLFSQARRRR